MIGQQEMLGIILTEALEADFVPNMDFRKERTPDNDEPTIQCDLRLVRNPDGTLEWID